MDKLALTKKVAKHVVGWSVAWTVGNIVANNVNPENKFRKAEAVVGGVVVGSMVADASEDYIEAKIDELHDVFTGKRDEAKLNLSVV